ncbi:hypothetical protein CFRS1_v002791 [Colletotrichum fructicola]|nr:hypothetical protein CFRS1_v002791 [Colletotrichum fructicola]
MLEQQIKELQATNEVLHVNLAALDDRPASRLSGISGGDIADSPTFRKGSRKLKKVIYVDGKAQVVTVPAKGDEKKPENEPESGDNDTDDKIIEDLKKQNEHLNEANEKLEDANEKLEEANEKLEEDAGTMLEVLEGSQSKSSQDVKKWKEKGSDKKKKKGKEKAKPRLKTASKDEDPEASSSSSSSDSDSSPKDDNNGGGGPSQSPEDKIKQLQEQNRLLKRNYFEAKQKAEDMEKDMDAMKSETPARAAGSSNDNSNKPGQKPEDKPEDKPARMNPRNKPNRNNSKPKAEGTAGTGPAPKSDPEFVFRYSEDMMLPLPASAIQKEDGKAPGDGDRDNKPPGDGNGRKGATEEVKDPWVFRVIMSIFKWYWLQVYNMCEIIVLAIQFKAIHHRNFAFLLVSVVWNFTFYFCLCNWFALHVSRELWARGNDLTRAYYIETTVRPKVHNMLGLGGSDYRFWPTINYFAGLFYEDLLGMSLSWNTSGLPWEARMAGEEGVFPVFLED